MADCPRKMGGRGQQCPWAATSSGCADWCRGVASEWASRVVRCVRAASDPERPALLAVDRLNATGARGTFLRGGDPAAVMKLVYGASVSPSDIKECNIRYLSPHRLSGVSLNVTACGITSDAPDEVADAWGLQYSPIDLLEFAKWRGYAKRSVAVMHSEGDDFILRDCEGKHSTVKAGEAAAAIAALMSDPSVKGARLMYSFQAATHGFTPREMSAMGASLDVKCPDGRCALQTASGYGGRTFYYDPEIANQNEAATEIGGAHVSLDCGDFVAQWHTLAHLGISLPSRGDKINFHAVMLW